VAVIGHFPRGATKAAQRPVIKSDARYSTIRSTSDTEMAIVAPLDPEIVCLCKAQRRRTLYELSRTMEATPSRYFYEVCAAREDNRDQIPRGGISLQAGQM